MSEKRKVLIVDDDAHAREILKVILDEDNYEIIEVESGEEAVQKYSVWKPDFVTMDLVMPGMGGVNATKKIIELDVNAKIMIITSLAKDEVDYLAMLGNIAVVTKPYQAKTVIAAINKLFE